jgi:dTDP-4-amino-4,6-dideoxygalactose transaminase
MAGKEMNFRIKQVDTHWQWNKIKDKCEGRFEELNRSGNYIQGKDTEIFEEEFAGFLGVQHFVAVANGTDALELILRAAGIADNSEVIIPDMTFFATYEAVVNAGAIPRIVDIEDNGLIDPEKVKESITSRTKAIIAVHLNGAPANMASLTKIARDYNLEIIEDACQAHCTKISSASPGKLSLAAAFSFYPGKNLGAIGDAGGVATDNGDLANKIRRLRDHGRTSKYEHHEIGRNSRMDSLQAIVLSEKLKFLDEWWRAREKNQAFYRYFLQEVPVRMPEFEVPSNSRHGNHLFPIFVSEREKLSELLRKQGIQITIQYPKTISRIMNVNNNFVNSERYAREVLSLPVGEHLTTSDLENVVDAIKKILA